MEASRRKRPYSAATWVLVLVLALPLVAAVVFLAPWNGGKPEPRPPAAVPSQTAPEGQPVAEAGAGPGKPRTLVLDELATPLDGPRLRVVDANTDRPLAKVAVLCVRGEDASADLGADLSLDRARAELLDRGRRLRADASGELRLPTFERDVWVCGAGGERGLARFAGGGPFTLVLARPLPLRLEVRDKTGEPCPGVPVALALERSGHDRSRVWTGTTGSEGQAVFDEASWLEGIARRQGGQVFAVLDLPLREPVARQVAPGSSGSPVVLTLPPTGQVRLELDPAVPALLRRIAVVVRATEPPGEEIVAPAGANASDGTVTFPLVGLGLELEASVKLPGLDRTRVSFSGPRAEGETVTVPWRLDTANQLVEARLRDEDGAALRDESVSVGLRQSDAMGKGSSSRLWLRTADDGAICVPLPAARGAALVSRSLAFTEERSGATAKVILPPQPMPGTRDLGVVTLRSPPLVAGGRAVDDAGLAAQDVWITVQVRRESGAWVEPQLLTSKTDDEGRFEICGDAGSGSLRLSVRGSEFLPMTAVLPARGKDDLELVLTRAAAATGRVLLDEGIEPWMLKVTACPRGGEAVAGGLDSRSRFTFGGLVPGPTTVTVAVFGVGVLREREIELPPGVPADVGDIDLRGELHSIAFTVVEDDGQPVENAWALACAIEQGRWEGVPLIQGAACLLSRTPTVDLMIRAKGPRCASFRGVAGGARLVMPPPVEVRVTVPQDAVAALEAGESLRVFLQPESGDGEGSGIRIRSRDGREAQWSAAESPWPEEARAARFDGDVARLPVPGVGTFVPNVCLERAGGQAPVSSFAELPRVRVTLPLVSQSVHVPLAADRITEARARLRGSRAK